MADHSKESQSFDRFRQDRIRIMEELASIVRTAGPVSAILTDDLSESIQDLYEVFDRYPVRRNMPHCECCVTSEDIDLICSKPLRELAAADLGKYAEKAITTWGDVEDWKHFLPRLMELIATEGLVHWANPETVFSRFREGKWEGWDPVERHAVGFYFVSLWRFVLSRYRVIPLMETPLAVTANDYLCAIAQATDDLSPYLRMWRADRSITALRHLADFVVDTLDQVMKDGTLGPWWRGRAAETQVKEWLSDPATTQRLEEGMASSSSGPFAASLSAALGHLVRLSKWIDLKRFTDPGRPSQ